MTGQGKTKHGEGYEVTEKVVCDVIERNVLVGFDL